MEEEIYRITDKKVIPTDSEKQSAEALVGRIVMVIQELLGENNIALTECKAIGIACPGMVDSRLGTVLYSNNLGWEDIALLDMLEQEIPIPMEIANDADTAALGEEEGSCRLQKSGCVGWEKPANLLTEQFGHFFLFLGTILYSERMNFRSAILLLKSINDLAKVGYICFKRFVI